MTENLSSYLFLFDIDGTILNSTGAGKKAFLKAFEKTFKVKIKEEVSFLGSIDFIIFKNLYCSFGFKDSDFEKGWKDFKKLYLKLLQSASKKNNWNVIPGADHAIRFLSKNSNISLVTGNIKKGALIKLKKFNLDSYFKCGGYGDSLTARKDIVKESVISSQNFYNKSFDNDNIYLFGDTKNDMDSAFKNNIHPVLIDPENKHKNSIKRWNIKFHGNFLNINAFFKQITDKVNKRKFLYFN